MLTTEERARFREWLQKNAADCRLLAKACLKLGIKNLADIHTKEADSCELIAKKLHETE